MTPSRPYLLRALWEWIVDNGMTPHILVDATVPGLQVPQEFVQEGRITLNLAHSAVQNLAMGNEEIVFSARFSGKAMLVVVPLMAVLAIFSRETGQGMMFGSEPGGVPQFPKKHSPALESRGDPAQDESPLPKGQSKGEAGGDAGRSPRGGKRRPGLRIVK